MIDGKTDLDPVAPERALERMIDWGDDRLLTPKEWGAVVGLANSTLQRMRRFGTGARFVQLSGTRVRYRVGDCRDYIRSLVRSSTSDKGQASEGTEA